MLVGIEGSHTSVVVGVVDYDAWQHLLIHLRNETSRVCPGQMVQVWEGQGELCTSTLIVRR